jgi:hypothetical protein
MQVYEFTLEIQDTSHNYIQREFVLANNDRAAARFAREFADRWRPNALHDHEHDVYSDPSGWPQWLLVHCAPIAPLMVPVVGSSTSVWMTLVPCSTTIVDGLEVVERLLRALCSPSLAACILRWIISKRLALNNQDMFLAANAVTDLKHWLRTEQSDQFASHAEEER